MCGITGALDLTTSKRSFPEYSLRAMSRAIAHRGPDGDGMHLEAGFAIACRRLALVDIQHGAQPMSNPAGSLWVGFNGELFNDDSLRDIFQDSTFQTRSDTELWLHLWTKYQEEMLTRVKGQYAVSLWDRDRQTLILARDRVGICPLYIAEADGWLLWASEIKALFASGLISPQPDPLGVDTALSFRCVGTRRTCFQGVRALAPGHHLIIKNGQQREGRHADINFPEAGDERRADPAELARELDQLLQEAIKRRLRGDVEVASYLSGGLDSSAVLSLLSANKQRPTAFTIGFEGAGVDERSFASQVAAAYGAKAIHIPLTRRSIADEYPALIGAAEAPVIDTSAACLLRLAREVRSNGFNAVLSGEGADEAFAGYIWYRIDKLLRMADSATYGIASRAIRRAASCLLGVTKHRSARLNGMHPPQHDLHEALQFASAQLYHPERRAQLAEHDPYEDLDLDLEMMKKLHPMSRAQYLDYKLLLPGLLLHAKGDRAAMHSGVEVRYPFLDDDVIDFASSISPELKLHGWTEKWILRRAMEKHLPANIARRTKKMFTADLSAVLLGVGRPPWVDQLLSEESIARAGWFDAKAVANERRWQSRLPSITPRRLVMDATLTGVVATQLWHHTFFGGGLCELSV